MNLITREEMLAVPAVEISDESRLVPEPLVSVMMMTYNHRPYIRQALEGVLGQQCPFPFEVLIGDDCSTDGTLEICQEFQRKFPERVRVITGPSTVRSKRNHYRLLARARGKYVAYCDGDDVWTVRDGLAKRVQLLERDPGASMCFADTEVVLQKSEDEPPVHQSCRRPPVAKPRFELDEAVEICSRYSHMSGFLLRRELLQFPRWYSRALSGDLCIVTLALLHGHALHLDQVTSVYRMTNRGIWTSMDMLRQRLSLAHTYSLLCAHDPERLRFIRTRYLLPLAVNAAWHQGRLRNASVFWGQRATTFRLLSTMLLSPLSTLRLLSAKAARWMNRTAASVDASKDTGAAPGRERDASSHWVQ